MKLISIGIVIIVLLVLLFFLRPRNTAFHRNVRPRTVKVLMFILILALIAAVIYLAFSVKKEGIGPLNSDRGATKETTATSLEDGAILEIRVTSDSIFIGNKKYATLRAVEDILTKAVSEGKNFELIDDYAAADLYLGVKNKLITMGADPGDITETREP
jgi:hypothetical protein